MDNSVNDSRSSSNAQPLDPQSGSSYILANANIHSVTNNSDQVDGRLSQRDILPQAVKGRLMRPVQDIGTTLLSVSTVVPISAGTSAFVTVTSVNNLNDLVLNSVYYQIYVDSYSDSGLMPQNISSHSYPFYIWNTVYTFTSNAGVSARATSVNRTVDSTISTLQIRNEAAGAHIFYFDVYIRNILNGSTGQLSS